MQTKLANDTFRERYVVEIDGIAKSEHSVFVKALTASLQLKQEFPYRSVKVRDADAKVPRELECARPFRTEARHHV